MLRDVWYVPEISRNLFSELTAQDRNTDREFRSSATGCWLKVNGEIVLHGTRSVNGTLFKADIEPIVSEKGVEAQLWKTALCCSCITKDGDIKIKGTSKTFFRKN
ncbi:hypothetical protein AVEN_59722-1 [Araneus ventricosus]|uniref:Uncharacterized protein n=1 Tax=Araneus ventricosus TaxID=182803 RepID=A0A4Y2BQI1_ARAVE|nr:hypothetical protein AVEN_59722-1 [Araneus ventricosus]